MRLTAISGYGQKGPACFLLEIAGRRLLLDCGKGPDDDREPDLVGVGTVDAVLVSHSHRDHTGALYRLGDIGSPPVFATGLAARLADIRAVGDFDDAARHLGLEIATGRCGHAPGAVWMRIGGAEGLLYTGDFSLESNLYPAEPWPRARALVADASYGAWDGTVQQALAELTALAAAGPLLLPAPAAGRGLEMALLLWEAGHRVRLCPVHRAVAAMLIEGGAELAPGALERLASLLEQTETLYADDEPDGVMIAAKADASGGLAAQLLATWRTGEVKIVFTGHVSRGTPAALAVAGGRASVLRWNVHPRLSDIRALLDAVEPEVVMPAFVPAEQLRALHAALPAIPWTEGALQLA
ncbi:hypothetical protein JP75_00065 [Devosia riboflavina]|uniref:MBL fold metallo-hydrolase n=3 Tax=Devosia TaxID=46913 RepID=A0A934J108_9HYPH|nr:MULTISPECIES: MBL fold metallo-hydrolase [Devosia]KFL32600.1 hypothetical protein JP75_00065 [Devosia riboflavina]MBJ3785639.1 MBL fold metallo-hydrolase [Devosia sediminis]QYO76642.1 MBL fold metallo-hydrolase [Devosia salina]